MSFNRIFQEKKAIAEIFYEIIYKRAEFTQNKLLNKRDTNGK